MATETDHRVCGCQFWDGEHTMILCSKHWTRFQQILDEDHEDAYPALRALFSGQTEHTPVMDECGEVFSEFRDEGDSFGYVHLVCTLPRGHLQERMPHERTR